MYGYAFDEMTGGLLLSDEESNFSKEPRPVYPAEMDALGFNEFWKYDPAVDAPYLWTEAGGNYFYRGAVIAKIKGGSLYEKPTLEPTLLENDDFAVPRGTELAPVDLDAMIAKNRERLSLLQLMTVRKIYNYFNRNKKKMDCFHVAFSGGKDSIVLLDLVKRSLPNTSFVVIFGDTGMEFSDTYALIDEVEEDCRAEGISFYRAKSDLEPLNSWRIFGAPSRVLRWCCSVHKSAPQTIKLREILGKSNYVGADLVGVRKHESVRRADYEYENFGMKQRGQYSFNPILEWNSAEIWLYIYSFALPINAAYKKGNSRAGCLFCPMSSGRADFFRRHCYTAEVDKYIDTIRETVTDENIDTYIENGGWENRRNGRDLKNPCRNHHESVDGDKLIITVSNPKTDWREWIKTLGEVPFSYEVTPTDDGCIVTADNRFAAIAEMKYFRRVFRKAAVCIGCRVCESNCVHGCISFRDGLHINNCRHCKQCHTVEEGCLMYHSTVLPSIDAGAVKGSLNTFADHAPKAEWVKEFFVLADDFFEQNDLGPKQFNFFKRFLFDAKLLDRKTSRRTEFAELVRQLGWESDVSWGLILINLVFGNPQIRWYVDNLPLGEILPRKVVEEKLKSADISEKDAKSIAKAFKRLCEIPLGTVLHFGTTTMKGRNLDTLTRTKAVVSDQRVVMYGLYKYAEACDEYQFGLTRLTETASGGAAVSPAKIFGLTRAEMEQAVNGLTARYPDFICATFTHDLEKISLTETKTPEDVLKLFEADGNVQT